MAAARLLCVALVAASLLALPAHAQPAAPPVPPVWATQWYADVSVTGWVRPTGPTTATAGAKKMPSKLLATAAAALHDSGDVELRDALADAAVNDTLITLLPRSAYGRFYWDGNTPFGTPQAAFTLTDAVTGVRTRSWSSMPRGTVYSVDSASGVCTSLPLQLFNSSASNRWSVPQAATFVADMGFAFVGNEYLLRDGVYYWTQHWTWTSPSGSGGNAVTIDYYHAVVSGAAFRLIWTQADPLSLQPIVVMDIGLNAVASFEDLPNTGAYLFAAPTSCPAHMAEADVPVAPDAAVYGVKAAPPAVGTPWPFAFSAAVRYTGNDMGLQPISPDALDEYVQQSLAGSYYYDWRNNREASVWHDTGSGAVGAATKTVITGGYFYALDGPTGTCVVPPTAPVNGPLRPTWPTNLHFVDTVVLQHQSNAGVSPGPGTATTTYQIADHYRWDAFNATNDHAFSYWQQPNTGVPLQFAGPVLDFWPYYQSFMQYSEFVLGLGHIAPEELSTIFAVPPLANCTVIPQSVFLTPSLWSVYDGASAETNNRLFAAISASLAPFSAGAEARRALFN